MFGAERPLDRFQQRFADAGRGIIVYLREGSVGVAASGRRARDDIEQPSEQPQDSGTARDEEWREIGLGAQILRDLGVTSIKLYASRERRYVGVEGFGIAITETVSQDD